MFGSAMLDVIIGLVLVYLLLSLMCSAIRESIASARRARSRGLAAGIAELLRNDTALVRAFYEHPQIWSLYRGDYDSAARSNKLPSYIPARSFAVTLLDLAARGRDSASAVQSGPEASALSVANVRRNIGNIGNPFVQRIVLSSLDGAAGDLERAIGGIESWFNSAMERVSGRYKRSTQLYLFVIGVVMTVALDVDSVRIARELYRDPARRQAAVAMAQSAVQDAQPGAAAAANADSQAVRAMRRLDSLGLPEAWPGVRVTGLWPDSGQWEPIFTRAGNAWFGWLITAFAISFGAPFWFDTLGKLIALRSTVKPKETVAQAQPALPQAQSHSQSHSQSQAQAQPRPQSQPRTTDGRHEWASGRPDGGIL